MIKKILCILLSISILLNIGQTIYIKSNIPQISPKTTSTTPEPSISNSPKDSQDYSYYFFMSNPIDNFFKDKLQNDIQSEMDRQDYQKFYSKIWKQQYTSIMAVIKEKCTSEKDKIRYKNFTNDISSSYKILQPLLLAEMLDNYTYPEGPEKYSYGNGTKAMLDMYQGMIYRNACMMFIPYLQDEYTFPTYEKLCNEYNSFINK